MSSFSLIELSQTVELHPKVSIKKGLFGLSKKAYYSPTKSQIESYENYFCKEVGMQIKQIIDAPMDKVEETIQSLPDFENQKNGDVRMDICISHDHKFVAMRLYQLEGEKYQPISKVSFLEGNSAEMFEAKLA